MAAVAPPLDLTDLLVRALLIGRQFALMPYGDHWIVVDLGLARMQ